ncbi:MAG: hypothetical protein MN733_17125, partial [Nitrososphaera sp.]|nr:hypothetical protein [Nitrososphaera sp.]
SVNPASLVSGNNLRFPEVPEIEKVLDNYIHRNLNNGYTPREILKIITAPDIMDEIGFNSKQKSAFMVAMEDYLESIGRTFAVENGAKIATENPRLYDPERQGFFDIRGMSLPPENEMTDEEKAAAAPLDELEDALGRTGKEPTKLPRQGRGKK